MAIIKATRVQNGRSLTYTWANITTADTGEAVDITELDDLKTLHVVGTGTAQRRRSTTT